MQNILRVIFTLILCYIISVLINPQLAPSFLPEINSRYEIGGWIIFAEDKVGHFFLIGLAALISNFLLQARRVKLFGIPFLLGSVIVAVFVTFEEFRQVPLTNRSFEILDIFYNFAGIFVFGRVGAWLAQLFSEK